METTSASCRSLAKGARKTCATCGFSKASTSADAFERMKTGELAATVLIAGKPTGAMAMLKSTSQDYPDLVEPGAAVETIAVSTVLVAYNWPRDSDRYHRIEKFVEQFFPRLAEFQKPPRHPKWVEANLAAMLPGWKRFPAAEEWLQRNSAMAQPGNRQQREQFERFLETRPQASSTQLTPNDRERLFQEFLKWSGTRDRR